MFWKRTIWGILFSAVFILLIIMAGVFVYKAGFTRGTMTEITAPEGGDINLIPHRYVPHGWHYRPHLGFFGFFPFFLCFGGFFFLMMIFGACRRHLFWKHAGKEHGYWKSRGSGRRWDGHPWGPGSSPMEKDQPESESDSPSDGTDQPEG